MAHYALLDKRGVVVQVITGVDEDEGIYDWEQWYSAETRLTAKRTSYNTQGGVHTNGGTPFRKNYAGIGYTYDPQRDAFIPPKPYPSWVLNEDTCLWGAPVPMPTDGVYQWDEATTSWVEVTTV
ncbi:MAG: hypothetical protein EB116_08535 [Betaproteobacteria bacterium]|nr:hypothetical protein [Betaproteobacteria bacterium]